jgi:hypothetical protein
MKPSPIRAARRAAGSVLPPRAIFGPSLVLERLARPGLLEDPDRFGHPLRPPADRLAEHVEFPFDVPVGEDEVQSPLAHEVDDGHILGQTQRIVERRDHRGDVDANGAGAGGHRSGQW